MTWYTLYDSQTIDKKVLKFEILRVWIRADQTIVNYECMTLANEKFVLRKF